ncbi:MAG: TIGR04282 family arsenosugar biosynthesis glycosyltransferase [Nocardioidaceae bacterium]
MKRSPARGVAGAVLLVLAKAPVAGLAKTRLAATVGPLLAADMAAAALLDTLAAAAATGLTTLVAITGDIARSQRSKQVVHALGRCDVFEQQGSGLGARLAHAHAEAARRCGSSGIVQIGMDTPHVQPQTLMHAAWSLDRHQAALGPAYDGGWWCLALRNPEAATALRDVPMSRPDTGTATRAALEACGVAVSRLPTLGDVDTWDDAKAVAATCAGRFADAVADTQALVVRRAAADPR